MLQQEHEDHELRSKQIGYLVNTLMLFCQVSDEKNACRGAGWFAEGRNSRQEKKILFYCLVLMLWSQPACTHENEGSVWL